MNNKSKNNIRHQFKNDEKELRILFRQYCNPIPDAPENEYDSIIQHLMSQLNKSEGIKELSNYVFDEFKKGWGITITREEAVTLAAAFFKWWHLNKPTTSANAG